MATIGIIGSGNIGAALAHLFTRAGHRVSLSNSRGPASLGTLATATGARAATVADVVQHSEIVVVAIPMNSVPGLPRDLFAHAPANQVVIDTSNYYPQQRDGRIAAVEGDLTESAWVAQHLQRPVIKVFNSIYAADLLSLSQPDKASARVALAIAGDDARSKAIVMQLVEDIGFDPVDAGTIAQSWRQQPGSPGYLQNFDAAGVRQALAAATPVRAPEWTATDRSPGTFDAPA